MFFESESDLSPKIITVVTTTASAICSLGLWLFIASCISTDDDKMPASGYISFIVGLIGPILMNILNWKAVNGEGDESDTQKLIARILFFISIVISIGSVVGAFCVMQFVYNNSDRDKRPGIELFIGTFIFHFGSVMFRLVRR